ncbi:hypothetical protein GOP47_0014850 [Adiantum capillus-veneris]|uniref:Cytoplasmic tRNA 2-thiolation protein 2 n=1 Tax=Adiantum capillus-veneris TaxID=13818 RepID=A0A9D4ZDW4_ADICA|nr:hypothetical protein GOP47_0014850 [Adiantum capillus-veneris]
MECGGQGCEVCVGSACSCSSSSRRATSSSWWHTKVCCKCKEAPAQVAANQTEVLCASCLNTSLFSKFKTAINMHDLIRPSHKVLLAFSGGPSSRVALEYLLEIREKAQRDAMHSSEGSARVFGFGVAFVNESAAIPLAAFNPKVLCQELRGIVMGGHKRPDEFLNIPIDSVYSDSELDVAGAHGAVRQERLQNLLNSVTDPTGKEDLLEHLRMQALQQAARKHGYTRLVLGLSTSRIAVKVISETSKGCGFSFPAGIQYYDARWLVPVVLPLRDCVAKELVLLCHFRNLKWVFIPTLSTSTLPQRTINSLSASFVSTLQEDNPSRERTIMRTAAKLQPFSFNRATSIEGFTSKRKGTTISASNGVQDMEDTMETGRRNSNYEACSSSFHFLGEMLP